MEKNYTKTIDITLKLDYYETCTILKGGVIYLDMNLYNIQELYETGKDINKIKKSLTLGLSEEALKNLAFMSQYIKEKEKMKE